MKRAAEEIRELKAQTGALILAHNYVLPEIQDIADFVGDSLELSIKAKQAKAPLMLFCGVRFMAETAKVLSPGSTVLIPNPDAGCPMADMASPEQIREWKKHYPGAHFAAYVNTTAATKAEVDICCTSGNAEKVVRSIPESEQIVFLPDRNLGGNLNAQLNRSMVLWEGFCPIHNQVTVAMIEEAKRKYPGAPVIVHPECPPEAVKHADCALSTAGMLKYVAASDASTVIVGTECGLLHRLRKENPGKNFVTIEPQLVCHDMKKITVEQVRDALKFRQYEVVLDPEICRAAAAPIEKMLNLNQVPQKGGSL